MASGPRSTAPATIRLPSASSPSQRRRSSFAAHTQSMAMFAATRRGIASPAHTFCPHWLRPSPRQAFLSTLAILEHRDGKLSHGALSAITAAQKLGGPIHGFVAGSNTRAAAQEAAKIGGIETVFAVENRSYEKASPLAPQNPPSYGADFLPRTNRAFRRACLRTSHRCSWRTSRKAAIHMLLLPTRPSART